MKIRMHRGSLEESMATVEEIAPTEAAVRAFLTKHLLFVDVESAKIEVSFYTVDPRISWVVHLVTINGGACAYTDQLLEG